MTNRELLQFPNEGLSAVQRQRRHALRVGLMPAECPACRTPTDAVCAAGIDVDEFRPGRERRECRCPRCGAELERVGHDAGPPWHWRIGHAWLADRLEKARLYDQMKEGDGGQG